MPSSSPAVHNPALQFLERKAQQHNGIFKKYGTSHDIQREVSAILFMRHNTSIPVPRVIDSCIQERDSWFSMDIVPGLSLTDTRMRMMEDTQEQTRRQLSDYLCELRALRPPHPPYFGSCTGGPAYDHRLNSGFSCGPFASVAEFHDVLVAPVTRCPRPELAAHYRKQLSDEHKIVFTHADLCGDHVFVDPGTGKVTGIVDWEMAGWWPAYWEYTKSLFGGRCMPWWKEIVNTAMDPYPSEREVDRILQQF